MATLNFDATSVEPNSGFEVLPAGWYNAMIDESEMKPTKDGSGAYLNLRYSIMGGRHNGQKVFQRLNLRNANPTAQEIAYKQLSAICHAIGLMQVQDSTQLHGQPLKIKLKVRKDQTGQYEDTNEISAVKNINETVQMADEANPIASAPAGFGAAPAVAPTAFAAPAQPAMQPAAAAPQPAWQQPTAVQPWATPAAAPAATAQPAAAPQPAWAAAPTETPAEAAAPAAVAAPAEVVNPEAHAAAQQAQAAVPPWQQQ